MSDTPVSAADPWDLSDVSASEMQALTVQPLSLQAIDWQDHLTSHWHNRLVSFPLVLAFVLVGLSRYYGKNPIYHSLLRRLWEAFLVLGWLAIALGEWQYRHFDAGQWTQLALYHRVGGYVSLALGTLAYGVWGRRHDWLVTGKAFWSLGCGLVLLTCVAFLGGVLSNAH